MSRYPTIAAGQRLTAELLQSMLPQERWKTAHEDRTSTTTFADDSDLTMWLEGNATYHAIFYLHYAAPSAAGFKTAWTVPAGSTGARSAQGPGSAVTDASASTTSRFGVHAFGTSVSYGTRNSSSNQVLAQEEAVIITTNPGTLAIQWAQDTSNAGITRVGIGSIMIVRRIA
ncbi:hypothetical protein STAN_1881 [Streptomyces sp. CBMAI 2042]|uniref:hypothetical protein n=1 Tax=Streptomyces sp. CBMAI 2042 TaxID=2305222 RepID=UPI000F2C76CA|nr:hypothetical protein [Streptomyces sp. CBMAI 2042]RLV66360.1 hypothetical protein STAN_1881 [Streptomyces sp. CBMAI 2042]